MDAPHFMPTTKALLLRTKSNLCKILLAGAEGFEPTHDGVKVRCLTAWRRPCNGVKGASQSNESDLMRHGSTAWRRPLLSYSISH